MFSIGLPVLSWACRQRKKEFTGAPGSKIWTVLPTPPEIPPVGIRVGVKVSAYGLIRVSSLVLWLTLKLTFQPSPRLGPSATR